MDMIFDVIQAVESSMFMSTLVLLSFSAMALVVLLLGKRMLDERLAEIRGARVLIDAHFVALERALDDPAMPEHLKDLLHSFSLSVTQEAVAHACAKQAVQTRVSLSQPASDRMEKLKADLEKLSLHRPDLKDDFAAAVSTGFTSMFLRWPSIREAVVKLHVSNTLKRPIAAKTNFSSVARSDLNETVDMTSRVFSVSKAGGYDINACAA